MSQLTQNNTNLQAILDAVNALPDKVEGATYETCTLFYDNSYGYADRLIFIQNTSEGATVSEHTGIVFDEFEALCDSIVYIHFLSVFEDDVTEYNLFADGVEVLAHNGSHFVLKITTELNSRCVIAPYVY